MNSVFMGQAESKIIGFFPFWFAIVVVNNSLANDPRVACDIKFENKNKTSENK